MNDQLPMFAPMTSEDTPSAISSPESEFGPTPCVSPDGPTTGKSGLAPVHANHSARPAKARRSTTKGIYGQSSFDSSKHDDLSFALASRLRPLTDLAGSTLFSLTWTVRVTPAGRSICALRASEPRTEGSVCIGWPTPDTGHSISGHGRRGGKPGNGHQSGADLEAAATMASWPTPQSSDMTGGGQAKRSDGRANLNDFAMLAGWSSPIGDNASNSMYTYGQGDHEKICLKLPGEAQLTAWKTPCVPNGGRISGNQTDIGKHQDGTKAQIGLENEAQLSGWTTPQAHDTTGRSLGQKEIHGTMHGCACLVSEARLTAFGETPIGYLLGPNGWEIRPASGQLSAAHSRWLMGLPPAWDDCGVTAMGLLRKSRKPSSKRTTPGKAAEAS